MTLTCADLRAIAHRWAASGEGIADSGEVSSIRTHMAGCPTCAARYAALPAFIEGIGREAPGCNAPGFSDRVMERIGRRRKRFVPVPVLAAAAAILCFTLGLWAGVSAINPERDFVEIRFSLSVPNAENVSLVGFFPDADADANGHIGMSRDAGGLWSVTVKLKKNGIYTYGFQIDGGETIPDPWAEEFVEDGFGGRDSLLRL